MARSPKRHDSHTKDPTSSWEQRWAFLTGHRYPDSVSLHISEDVCRRESRDHVQDRVTTPQSLRSIPVLVLLRGVHERMAMVEQQLAVADCLASNLPSREFVDKLVRYESALDRRKEKLIKLLWELQACRKGLKK